MVPNYKFVDTDYLIELPNSYRKKEVLLQESNYVYSSSFEEEEWFDQGVTDGS